MTDFKRDGSHLAFCPSVEEWDDWVELDPEMLGRAASKSITSWFLPFVSTVNLLVGCWPTSIGSGQVAKFEGNPMHPASRGGFAPRARLRSIRFMIPTAFCIR